ncbi:MAG: hypothetical protein R3316_03310 [Rhodovibrionaceae bacterium]|nr:hypothetical protein [Rhodovibrionaceae bacterium]
MGFAAPSARILGGALVLALALTALLWDRSVLRDGFELNFAVGPSAAWAAIGVLGLAGLMLLADGFFRFFNRP